jgi:hypothetical protein
MKKNKIILYTKETPTSPRKVINLSDEQGELIMKHLDRLKRDGKILSAHKVDTVTEHDYLEYEIQNNVEVENYEECARLLKIKNETPYSEEKTKTIRETI